MIVSNANARMSRSIHIRSATLSDAQRIAAVINSAFHPVENFFIDGDRIDLKSVLEYIDNGTFLLAESDGTLLGVVYLELRLQKEVTQEERAYLGLLSVDPAQQQVGVGSLLMDAGEDYCRNQGARVMDIKVINLRKELIGFYQRRGYVESGTSPFPESLETKLPVHFVDMSKDLRFLDNHALSE